jgi:hypothetical protein
VLRTVTAVDLIKNIQSYYCKVAAGETFAILNQQGNHRSSTPIATVVLTPARRRYGRNGEPSKIHQITVDILITEFQKRYRAVADGVALTICAPQWQYPSPGVVLAPIDRTCDPPILQVYLYDGPPLFVLVPRLIVSQKNVENDRAV